MIKEFSYGVIPIYKNKQGDYEILLVQIKEGTWGFPKGHIKAGETEKQTAERELFEETGLSVIERYTEKIFNESYVFMRGNQKIDKHVGYLLGRVATKKVALQNKELDAFARVSFQYAQEKLSFPKIKDIAAKAQEILLTK